MPKPGFTGDSLYAINNQESRAVCQRIIVPRQGYHLGRTRIDVHRDPKLEPFCLRLVGHRIQATRGLASSLLRFPKKPPPSRYQHRQLCKPITAGCKNARLLSDIENVCSLTEEAGLSLVEMGFGSMVASLNWSALPACTMCVS
jgi:hypothetical protein